MSHRGKDFIGIAEDAEARLRALMDIPDNYRVLFLQGGATGQFVGVCREPVDRDRRRRLRDHRPVGQARLRRGEQVPGPDQRGGAHRPAHVRAAAGEWSLSTNAGYVHITLNETVNGVVFDKVPDTGERRRSSPTSARSS